ncbi:MAG: plastocyanin/azurin family copper-binding protein [Acidimicrobiia bacterium]
MRSRKPWVGLAVMVVAALPVPTAGAAAESDHGHEVVLQHGKFVPAEVEVEVGETVTWRHEDGEDPQSVTADDGSFDSHPDCTPGAPEQCMKGGETFSHTFTRTGRIPYHSRTEDMAGVVTVVEGHQP